MCIRDSVNVLGNAQAAKDYFKGGLPTETHEQIMLFREKFSPFYQKTKIKVITDDQVRQGIETVGIDTQDSKEHQEAMGIKPDGDKKYVKCTYKNLNENDPEVAMNQKDASQIKSYLPAAIANPNADGVLGLEEADVDIFNQKVIDLESKEADLIHDLYTTHFVTHSQAPPKLDPRNPIAVIKP